MKVTQTLEVPMTPNFVRTVQGHTIPIQDLADKHIREIGKRWTNMLLMKARKRRAAERQP